MSGNTLGYATPLLSTNSSETATVDPEQETKYRSDTVWRLYIVIACLAVLTVVLYGVHWLVQSKKLRAFRGLGLQGVDPEDQYLSTYRGDGSPGEIGTRFKGLLIFRMSSANN